MPYCKNCGSEVPEGATFCSKCGTPIEAQVSLVLASWVERFIAWIIDIIILSIAIAPIRAFTQWLSFGWTYLPFWIPFFDFSLSTVLYFLYWTVMDGAYGQSIGKMLMKIKVTQLDGRPANIGQALIEAIGKAFLLPLDCILGWLLYPRKRQRLFNHASDTVVVRVSGRTRRFA